MRVNNTQKLVLSLPARIVLGGKNLFIVIVILVSFVKISWADVVINVLAINGAPEKRETPIRFVLPSDLKSEDIVDADGLALEYDVNEGSYVAQGVVTLDPKESKTFRIKVRDVWKVNSNVLDGIKGEIEEAHDKLGKVADKDKTQRLKEKLLDRLDFVVTQQSANNDSVEKRIDTFRIYHDRLEDIKRDALSVDFWRSNPDDLVVKTKLVRMVIEVENAPGEPARKVEQKHYLPSEVKPEYVVSREDFEIKFDQEKQKPYLFKEDEFTVGQKKRYEIGIQDVWFVLQNDIDYLNQRANYAYNFLKESKFEQSAKYLFDRAEEKLNSIQTSQSLQREIREHISAFRLNVKVFEAARKDVEDLEKLVAIYREELEKTKVTNVLQKVRSLNSVAEVSDSIFKKKPKMNTTWQMIGWVLLFVGGYMLIHFIVWGIRSAGVKRAKKDSQNKTS